MGEQGEEGTKKLELGRQADEVLGAGRKERGMGASGYKMFHFSGRSGEAICRKETRSPSVQAGVDLLPLKDSTFSYFHVCSERMYMGHHAYVEVRGQLTVTGPSFRYVGPRD